MPAKRKAPRAPAAVAAAAGPPASAAAPAAAAPPPAAAAAAAAAAAGSQPAAKRRHVAAGEPPRYKGPRGHCFTFGEGPFGALGLGEDVTAARRPAHVPVADNSDLASVQCGGMHTAALTVAGQVYTWGVNDEGALGRPTSGSAWQEDRASPKEDPALPGRARLPPAAPPAAQVAAGDGFTLALLADGAVWGWGTIKDDTSGAAGWQPGVPLQRLPALLRAPPSSRERVVRVAAGARHVLLLSARGDVLSFGMGGQGQLGRVPPYGTGALPPLELLLGPAEVPGVRAAVGCDVAEVAAGSYTSFALSRRGALAAWGLNSTGQLGLPPSGGEGGTFLWEPTRVAGLPPLAAVAGGEKHTLLLTRRGELLAAGDPTYGQLGNGADGGPLQAPPAPVLRPDQLAGERAAALAAGCNVSGCVTAQGNAYLWGSNTNGQLAAGPDEDDALAPARMRRTAAFGHRPVLQLSFGGQHGALLAGPDPGAPLPGATPSPGGGGAAAAAAGGGSSSAPAAAAAAAAAPAPAARGGGRGAARG